MRWLRRTPKHRHDWVRVGGLGWSLYECITCPAKEIDA